MLVGEIPALRDYWYPIGYAGDLGAAPTPFRLFGEPFVAWRPEEGAPPLAAVDVCPHRAARLSQGWVEEGQLVCPYHGWRYEGGGACTLIPANDPDLPIPSRARLRTIPAADRYGLVWVCAGEPRAGIPDLVEAEDPEYVLIHEMMEEWGASAPRIIDNALDVSHVAWTHRNSVGDRNNPRLSDYTLSREGERLTFSVTYTAKVDDRQSVNTGIAAGLTTRSTHAELVQPLVFRGVLEYHDNGLRHVLFKTATPVDDRTTLFCQFIARNDRPTQDRWGSIRATDRLVQSEDRALLEAIDPDFPTAVTTEVHTRADRMTVEYRRILADLAAEGTGLAADGTAPDGTAPDGTAPERAAAGG
ncbi:MAG: Rieske 2Fe-2S domain-containing protein [Acidimicrobiales bacterium]